MTPLIDSFCALPSVHCPPNIIVSLCGSQVWSGDRVEKSGCRTPSSLGSCDGPGDSHLLPSTLLPASGWSEGPPPPPVQGRPGPGWGWQSQYRPGEAGGQTEQVPPAGSLLQVTRELLSLSDKLALNLYQNTENKKSIFRNKIIESCSNLRNIASRRLSSLYVLPREGINNTLCNRMLIINNVKHNQLQRSV